jgi:hypothetical protein
MAFAGALSPLEKENRDSFRRFDHRCGGVWRCHRLTSHHLSIASPFMSNPLRVSASPVDRTSASSILPVVLLSTMFLSVTGCGSGGQDGPIISTTSSPAGATASLAWDPVQDPSVTSYNVYYGKQSSGQSGSCSYQENQAVSAPTVTITGLDPDTRYFFAVSAYNGLESPCSNEVSTVTPPAQT